MTPSPRPFGDHTTPPGVVAIAGGSGAGKSTIARSLLAALGSEGSLVDLDRYYRDRPELGVAERTRINYDHPDALEWDLLVHHLDELREGRDVSVPDYDYARHRRRSRSLRVEARPVIILDGILALHDRRVRAHADVAVFVHADPDLRLARRLRRDTSERGRSVDGVIDQYLRSVRPMHQAFVEPTRSYADLVIDHGVLRRRADPSVPPSLTGQTGEMTPPATGRTEHCRPLLDLVIAHLEGLGPEPAEPGER